MEQIQINFKQIPEFLRGFHNWVNWKFEDRDGKQTKVPVDPKTGLNAKSNDPSTWGTFEQAKIRYLQCRNDGIEGIGFMFTKSPLSGIDLDHCRNKETGEVEPWAKQIVNSFQSYTEITPSCEGLHIIILGNLPGPGRKNGGLEVYSEGRFFTITGNTLPGAYVEIYDRQRLLTEFYQKHFPDKPVETQELKVVSPTQEDRELMNKALHAKNGEKLSKLMLGQWQEDYPSESEGDLAFCNELAFWTQDPEQIDRIFRTSKLFDSKWDSKRGGSTYGALTIQKALAGTKEHYQPAAEVLPITEDLKETQAEPDHIGANMEPNQQPEKSQGEAPKKSIINDFRIWFENCEGIFSLSQIYADLSATTRQERDSIRQDLIRLLKKGQIERLKKQGDYRKIKQTVEKIHKPSIKPIPLPIKFPCGIEEYLKLYRGHIVVIGGAPNQGKTSYCLNLAKLNMDRFRVNYISSEEQKSGEELYERLEGFRDHCLDEMFDKINFVHCTNEFQDAIEPDSLNIVDYLEIPDGEFYKVQDQIRKIFDKLADGVAVICIQKNRGAELPKGGTGTIEKARIALMIENDEIAVVKGKLWKNGRNPRGLRRTFKLWGGVNFEWGTWQEAGYAN